MMHRLLWLGVCAGLSFAVGCGDDGTSTDGGTVALDGPMPDTPPVIGECTDIDMAPNPEELMGACCYRASNADRLDMPELRLAGIAITEPPSLFGLRVVIGPLLRDALDSERFNWIMRTAVSGTDVTVTTGYGERNADGTFSFVMGGAPAPGDPNRWDPVMIVGTIDGEVVTTMPVPEPFSVPVIDPDGTSILTEFPLQSLRLVSATLSENRSCIGTRGPGGYRTGDGTLEAFIGVEDSKGVMIMTDALTASLCDLLRGQADEGTNCVEPQAEWNAPPDSTCDATGCTAGGCTPDTCNAWRVTAEFAAHGVEITP